MRIRTVLSPLLLILAASGCSDDFSGPAVGEFDELCGKNEPLRILPLDSTRVPAAVLSWTFGERYVYGLGFGNEAEERVNDIWSVGRCGEEPTKLADGVDGWLQIYQPYAEVPFVCRHGDGALLALDPTGWRPANPVFETRDCFAQPNPRGLLTILGEGDTGPLVLQPWPDDPSSESASQIVLVDEVKALALPSPHNWPNEREVFASGEDEALAVTVNDELVAVDLDSLEVTVLATGVREFERGWSGRWIVWQGTEITNDDPEWPTGPIFALDRESGEVTELDDTALAYALWPLGLESLGLLHYRVAGWSDSSADRFVDLETMTTIDMFDDLVPWAVIDETRAMFKTSLFSGSYVVVDTSTGERTTIFSGDWVSARHGPNLDGIVVHRERGGELVKISYSGESRILARHVEQRYRLTPDDRVVTPYAIDDEGVGQLVITDSATLDEAYIDHQVQQYSATLLEGPAGEMLVSYLKVDPDPEQFGVWLARPK